MAKLKLLMLVIVIPFMTIGYSVGEDNEGVSDEQTSCTTHTITKVKVKGFPEDSLANEISTYVYNTYGLDYLLLLRAENGTFEPMRQHNVGTKHCVKGYDEENQRRISAYDKETGVCYGEWKTFYDYGLCGFNEYWHPEIVYNTNFSSRQRQADKCVELKDGGTVFYGWNKRLKYKNDFIFEETTVCD